MAATTTTAISGARDRRRRLLAATRWGERTVALVLSIGFGLIYGFNYGISNHNSYLLRGLRLAEPGTLDRDWLATGTTSYHVAFPYLAWPLFELGRGGWPFAIANVIANAGCGMLVYALVRAIVPRQLALGCFLLVMAIEFSTLTNSVGRSYLVGEIFQPSTLGAVGLLAAIVLFLNERWLASGMCLAVGGLFHGNYLLLGLGVMLLAHLALGGAGLARRLVRQLAPAVPVLLLMAPLLLRSATDPERAAAQAVLGAIRAPHHYAPGTYEAMFLGLAGWQALGLGAGGFLLTRPEEQAARLGAVLIALCASIWGATVLTTVHHLGSVQQLLVWRLSPLSDLLFQILACAGAVRLLRRPSALGSWQQLSKKNAALVLVGVGVLLMFSGNRALGNDGAAVAHALLINLAHGLVLALAIAKLASMGASALASNDLVARARSVILRRRGRVVALACCLIWTGVAHTRLAPGSIRAHSSLLRGPTHEELELYAWIGRNTPRDAVFLVPPALEDFRFHARRAIVVDWKTTPIVPTEVMEWFRRLSDVAGRPVTRLADVTNGYRELDRARVEALRKRYGFDYVLVSRRAAVADAYRAVFQGRAFQILDSRAPTGP